MEIPKFFFFLFPFLAIVFANNENHCPNSYCNTFSLHYPFKLQTSQPLNSCTYINLTCDYTQSTDGTPMLRLPYGGDFYVRYIGYYESQISLYDPENCLMRRLMNLNLSSSPLKAVSYENYTFYSCPANASIINHYVFPIDCLSNSTYSTVATTDFISPALMFQNDCAVVGSWLLPVLWKEQFEFDGINGDLYLKWDSIPCSACKGSDYYLENPGGSEDSLWTKFAASPLFIPSFVALATFLVILFLQIIKLITGMLPSDIPAADTQPESDTATTALPRPTTGGLDDSKISSCTRLLVISENRINVSNTCSICLETYVTEDVVRSIAKCEHCFHADCIELWLRKNNTCPVCRTVLSDVVL